MSFTLNKAASVALLQLLTLTSLAESRPAFARDGPQPTCHGVKAGEQGQYGLPRDIIADMIEKQFCPDLNGYSGSAKNFSKEYNKDQKTDVAYTVQWSDKKPSQDDCKHYMEAVLLDNCDTDTTSQKVGGTIEVDGVTWSWEPKKSQEKAKKPGENEPDKSPQQDDKGNTPDDYKDGKGGAGTGGVPHGSDDQPEDPK